MRRQIIKYLLLGATAILVVGLMTRIDDKVVSLQASTSAPLSAEALELQLWMAIKEYDSLHPPSAEIPSTKVKTFVIREGGI